MIRNKIKYIIIFIVILLAGFTAFQSCNANTGLVKEIKNSINIQTFKDYNYKKSIISLSQEPSYTIEKLKPLMGPDELAKFIKANNHNPQIYTPSEENIKNGVFRANFHMHTVNSDGAITVEEMMEKALEYAKTLPEGEHFYMAITDHNTVLGAKDIIKVLQSKPEGYYSKLKIVPGIEIFTDYINFNTNEKETDIHVLTWCINPFDEFLNKEFYKADLNDRYNFKTRTFEDVIKMMKDYGIVGVAHPARYSFDLGERRLSYIPEMLQHYIINGKSDKPLFVEGYYQSYPLTEEFQKYIDFINEQTEKLGIIKTGSTDSHGDSIFHF